MDGYAGGFWFGFWVGRWVVVVDKRRDRAIGGYIHMDTWIGVTYTHMHNYVRSKHHRSMYILIKEFNIILSLLHFALSSVISSVHPFAYLSECNDVSM